MSVIEDNYYYWGDWQKQLMGLMGLMGSDEA